MFFGTPSICFVIICFVIIYFVIIFYVTDTDLLKLSNFPIANFKSLEKDLSLKSAKKHVFFYNFTPLSRTLTVDFGHPMI